MKTFTANSAKQQLGQVLNSAIAGPVSITRHGRPAFVVTSKEDYDELMQLKFERFKREAQRGFEALDRGEITKQSISEIAAEALEIFRQETNRETGR